MLLLIRHILSQPLWTTLGFSDQDRKLFTPTPLCLYPCPHFSSFANNTVTLLLEWFQWPLSSHASAPSPQLKLYVSGRQVFCSRGGEFKDTECLKDLMGKCALREKWKAGWVDIERVGGLSVLVVMLINKFPVLYSIVRVWKEFCLISSERVSSSEKERAMVGSEGRKDKERHWKAKERTEVFWCELGLALMRVPPLLFRFTLPRSEMGWLGQLFGTLRGLFPYQRVLPLRKHDCGPVSVSVLCVYSNRSSFYAN